MSRSPWMASGLVALLVFSACAVDSDSDVSASVAWIVDGIEDTNPAVVMVYNGRAGGLCSGSIIAPRIVLTAKHCVQSAGAATFDPPSSFTIGIGDNINRLTQTLSAVEVTTTPGMYTDRGLGGLVGEDVALITLRTGVTIAPIPIHRGPPRDQIGEGIMTIGFGQTPSGRTGTKYHASDRIRYIDGDVIYTGPISCQGDSGGPVILESTGEQIGVTSFGTGACGSGGIAGVQDLYSKLALIDGAIGMSGACLDNGAEVCDGYDNDCNDEIDEICSPLGTPCVNDDECVGLNCATTSAGRICSTECDPLRPELSCPTGLYCSRSEGCAGLCVPLPATRPDPKGNDQDCTTDLECASLFCVDPGDGRQRCLEPCRGDEGTCYAGEVCAAGAGACGACVPAAIVVGARGLGEPCGADGECGSSMCHVEADLAYCTRSCATDGDCVDPDRFHCREDVPGMGVCITGPREGVGGGCIVNGDCRAPFFCASRGGTRWCTEFCDEMNPCMEGFDCTAVGERSVCAPSAGLVGDDCMVNEDCLSNTCADLGGGRAVCTRICGPDAACAAGFECERTADGTSAVCVAPSPVVEPTDSGGCSASGVGANGAAGSSGVGFALVVVAAAIRRRRRRRK